MSELLVLLKDASPFVIAAIVVLILGREYFKVRAKEADAAVIKAENEKETAKYQSEAEIRRDARDEKVAIELAQYRAQQTANVASTAQALQQNTTIQGQTVAAIASLTGQQAASETTVTGAIGKSETNVIQHVEASKDQVLAALNLLGKFNTEVFKPVAAQPPDLQAMQKILEAALRGVEEVQKRQFAALTADATGDATVADAGSESEVAA